MGDYMSKMSILFYILDDVQSEDVDGITEEIMAVSGPVVKFIGSLKLDKIKMYKDNVEKAESYYSSVEEPKVGNLWLHFLQRTVDSPTTIHRRGVVILVLPLLKRAILELENANGKN